MTNDELTALSGIKAPKPNATAREQALDAAMLAFDQNVNFAEQRISSSTQESARQYRLTSTLNQLWSYVMNSAVKPVWNLKPASLATATALVALPVAAIVTWNVVDKEVVPKGSSLPLPAAMQEPEPNQLGNSSVTEAEVLDEDVAVVLKPKQKPVRIDRNLKMLRKERGVVQHGRTQVSSAPLQPQAMMAREAAKIAPVIQPRPAPVQSERYTRFEDQGVLTVADNPLSTFSIDVDTASYARIRASLNAGSLPPKDMVRVEEMINYFDYDYPVPEDRSQPFKPTVSITPTPWNQHTSLMTIGIKGYDIPAQSQPDSNLVFLLDVSGSMNQPNKLPLLVKSFQLLLQKLKPTDKVSIVTYAGRSATVLDSVAASDRATIRAALQNLQAGGSTAGAGGIERAYELAEKNFIEGGVNRVMLATDGDFNVGISDPEQLKDLIAKKRKSGVFLSVFGFGQGNYNDALMQKLAQNGNGQAAYIDTLAEAQKTLVEEAHGSMFTIAKDVKIQIEFNPAKIAEYRLIGYETRALNNQDFNNDKVDAGEIGAGHSVTAIYELTPVGSPATLNSPLRYGKSKLAQAGNANGEIGFVKLRYKLPDGNRSLLLEHPITYPETADETGQAGFSAAVAAFGQKLRGNVALDDFAYEQIANLARSSRGEDQFGYRGEFIRLVNMAKALSN